MTGPPPRHEAVAGFDPTEIPLIRIGTHPGWSVPRLACAAWVVAAACLALPARADLVSGRYVGDGSGTRAITGLPFTPDLVIVKGSNRTPAVARSASMTGDNAKELGALTKFRGGEIKSLAAGGFTVGGDAAVNQAGALYEWVAFDAAPGVMSTGSYTGTGGDNRSITVGFTPAYVLLLSDHTVQAVQRFATETGDASRAFADDVEHADWIQSLDPSGFTVGASAEVNRSTTAYHWVAWSFASGGAFTGSYLGNAVDDRGVSAAGLQPYAMIVARAGAGSASALRLPVSHGGLTWFASADSGFANGVQSLTSTGFVLGTHAAVNASPAAYHWVSFQNAAGRDVALSLGSDRLRANAGDSVRFEVVVADRGPQTANGVQASVVLPAAMTAQYGRATRGTVTSAGLAWKLDSLAAAQAETLFVTVTVNPGSEGQFIAVGAAAAGSETDLYSGNNADAVVLTVPSADVELHVVANDLAVTEGQSWGWSITATNNGPAVARDLVVGDALPAGFAFGSSTPGRGTYAPGTHAWSIDSLASGETATLSLTATIGAGSAGTVVRPSASIVARGQSDPAGANDTAAVSLRILDARARVVSGSYTGNGASLRAITGVGFQPDLVIVKGPGATPSLLRTRLMSGDASKELGENNALVAGRIKSLDFDGFSIGSDASVNQTGAVYTWTGFLEVPGQLRVGSYVGDGADNRAVAGLGLAPAYMIVAPATNKHSFERYAAETGDASLNLNGGTEQTDRIQRLDADGFQLGQSGDINGAGVTYYYAAWGAIAGIAASGSYVGDGIDNRSIEAPGFRPGLLLVTRPGASTVQRNGAMPGDLTLPVEPVAGFADAVQALAARGFQVGTHATVNSAAKLHYYAAFRSGVGADLDLSAQLDRPTPNEGDTVTVRYTLRDFGPQDSGPAAVAAPIPSGLTFVSFTASRGGYVPGSGVWSVGTIANGDSASLVLSATVNAGTAGGTIVETAQITAPVGADAIPENDVASASISVRRADLRVTLAVDDRTPTELEPLTLTITVKNLGPTLASGIVIDAPPPPLFVFDAFTATTGAYATGTGAWSIGSIAVSDSAVLTLRAHAVTGAAGATSLARARVTARATYDPQLANDADSTTVMVQAAQFRVLSGSYVGDGTGSRAVSGLGFQPDVVIVKGAGATSAVLRVKGMPADAAKDLAANSPFLAARIRSLDVDGFTVGSDAAVNTAGTTYYWTAFLEAPGQLKTGSYTGNGADDRGITGLGLAPAYVIVAGNSSKSAYQRFGGEAGDASLSFSSSTETADRIQRFDPDGFQVGTAAEVNTAGAAYHYVAWAPVASRAAGGLYLGDGTDDRTIPGAGFRPGAVIVKRQDTGQDVVRAVATRGDLSLPMTTAAFANGIQSFSGAGFQVGTDTRTNLAAKVYFWQAFRDLPNVDVAVTQTVSDSLPDVGDPVTLRVGVAGRGPASAANVNVTETLPALLQYQSHIASRGTFDSATGVWTLGTLAPGDTATLTLQSTVKSGSGGQSATTTAAVSGLDQSDLDVANDQAAASLRVPTADVSVTAIVNRSVATESDTLDFITSIANHGPDAATNVTLSDPTPAGFTRLASTPSRGTFVANTGVWTLGTLAPGDSATLQLKWRVNTGTLGTTLRNIARVTHSDQADLTVANDADTAAVFVEGQRGVTITATQGSSVTRPAASAATIVSLSLLNSGLTSVTLQQVTFVNRTGGTGTQAQRDAELGTLRLGSVASNGGPDTPIAQAAASGGLIAFGPFSVTLPAGAVVTLRLTSDVALTARDGDTLDVSIDAASRVVFATATTVLNSWPVDPAGGVVVDGSAAAQFKTRAVTSAAAKLAEPGVTRIGAVDVLLPANGYASDVLQGLKFRNYGDAAAGTDIAGVELWRDGGDGAFDAGDADDQRLGSMGFDGAAWSLTALSMPIPAAGQRVFASVDLASSARAGRLVRLGIPGALPAMTVASANDGPADDSVLAVAAITILRAPSTLRISVQPQTPVSLLPGRPGVEVLRFQIVNSGAEAETLTSVAFANRAAGPGTAAQLGADWLPVSLSDGTRTSTASFASGRATLTGLNVVVSPGDTVTLRVKSGASLTARDGDLLDLEVPAVTDVGFSRRVNPLGTWPLTPSGVFPVDGMSLAQLVMTPQKAPELLTGSVRNLALDLGVPGDGYEPDTLQSLGLRNLGDAAPGMDISRLEAWSDDGDGVFEPASLGGDHLLGTMVYTGGGWTLGGFSLPIAASGQRLFVSCDIAAGATERRTVRLGVPSSPLPGIGMSSPNDGPRDADALNPVTLTISTLNRMTFAALDVAPGVTTPGDTEIVVLHLVATNSYADSARTLRGLAVTNQTHGAGAPSPVSLDAEVRRLALHADTPSGPLLATGFFSGGRAVLGGFGWAIPPGGKRDLYVTADVSSSAAADGDVIGVTIAEEEDLVLGGDVTLSARFPLGSGAAWTIDGMVAAQIALRPAPAATLGPGEGPSLALDWTVPRNGYRDDVLEGVRLVNAGTALPSDLAELHLWKDGGNGAFDAGVSDDQDLGALSYAGGVWLSRTLAEAIGSAGLRLFAAASASASPVDSASVRLQIPVGGIVVSSGDDGPADQAVAATSSVLLSTSHLLATVAVLPAASVLGDTVTALMTVRNVGGLSITGVTPATPAVSGPGAITPATGASPAILDLAPGTQGTFTWRYVATGAGTVALAAGATGTELGTGAQQRSLIVSSDVHQIFNEAGSLDLYALESMPFSVIPGQARVIPLTLTLASHDAGDASDVLLRTITVRFEDESGAGVTPSRLLERMAVNEGVQAYLDQTSFPSSGSTVDLVLSPPVLIESGGSSGGQVTLSLALDVSDTTTVSTFRMSIIDAGAFTAQDAVSGAPVAIAPASPQSYPIQTGLARVVANATELDVSVASTAPAYAGRGQNDVTLLDASMVNPGPGAIGPDIRLSRFDVVLIDANGVTIAQPSRVIERIKLAAGSQHLLDRAVAVDEDSTITLSLSPVLALPLNQAAAVTISADLAADADLGVVRIRIADTSSFVARNANTGEELPVMLASQPLDGGPVTVLAQADSITATGTPRFASATAVGATGVAALSVTLTHPGGPLTGRVRLDALTLWCRNAASAPLAPAAYVDRARVVIGGVDAGVVTDLPGAAQSFTIPLTGITLDPGTQTTLELRVDVETSAPTASLALTLSADGVVAHDENLGTAVAVGAGAQEFPFTSGLTQLQAPARELIAAFTESMPAVLAADGRAEPVAALTLRNPAASGDIMLDHLELLASDRAYATLATGSVSTRLEAWIADTLWATSGPLTTGNATAVLTAVTPLVLGPNAAIAVQLRHAARPGAGAAGYRLGCRADGIGVIQPGSSLLTIAVTAAEGQSFPFWTRLGGPTGLTLEDSYSNFPNPFAAGRQQSRFVFYMKTGGRVTLELWTLRGDRVCTLLSGAPLAAGLHQDVTWDGRNGHGGTVVNGAYVAEIRVDYDDGTGERIRRKVAVVR